MLRGIVKPMARTIRRCFRVSLRTLFVLLTICAVWLGILSKNARDQKAAVRRILELGGAVTYDFQQVGLSNGVRTVEPPGWRWLRRLIGDEYFQEVVAVNLSGKKLSDDNLIAIRGLTKLVELGLANTPISDVGTRHLNRLGRLRYVDLSETRITSEGLRFLSGCHDLATLRLVNARGVDDDGLQHLRGLPRLQSLDLTGTSVSLAGLSELRHLEYLNLSAGNAIWDDACVEPLIKMGTPTSGRPVILVGLDVRGSRVSGKGLLSLRDNLPSCRVDCDMAQYSRHINRDRALHPWIVCDQAFQQWIFFVSGVERLHADGRIRLIDLSHTIVVDEQLLALYHLKNIEAIDLRGTRVTEAARIELQRALPNAVIIYDAGGGDEQESTPDR
jgi:hypothetical protein